MMDVGDLMLYGSDNKTFGDKICAFVFAIAPLLQHYKGIVENAGFTVLILITPLLFLATFKKFKTAMVNKRCFFAIIPLIIFFFYTFLVRDFNGMRLGYVLLLSWVFICISYGAINISYFFKYATIIAVLATIAIIIQDISHYLIGRTIDFRPLSLLVSQNVIWVKTAVNYGAAGYMYRPSGFFLEPSHFFLYSFPLIAVLLFSVKKNKKHFRTALFLSLGLLLTTSGMGIAVLAGLWTLYFTIYKNATESTNNVFKLISVRSVIIIVVLGIVFYLAYRFVPFIYNAVERILTEDETSNAIDGRTRLVKSYVSSITGRAVWFGTPVDELRTLEFNVPGFFATYIKFGILGLLFSYWFYLQGLFKLKGPYFWLTLIIVVISYFTAHTHGTFYMLYFVFFLMNGYYESGRNRKVALGDSEVDYC